MHATAGAVSVTPRTRLDTLVWSTWLNYVTRSLTDLRTALAVAILCGPIFLQAQTSGNAMKSPHSQPPVGLRTNPAAALNAYVTVFETDITSLAQAMPEQKYNFSPASLHLRGANFEGVRTFAAQVKHVAQDNFYNAAEIMRTKPADNIKAIADLKTKDQMLAALAASFLAVHQAVNTITPQNAFEVIPGSTLQTKLTSAAAGAAHGYDHYGQMVEYARMNGVIPPPPPK